MLFTVNSYIVLALVGSSWAETPKKRGLQLNILKIHFFVNLDVKTDCIVAPWGGLGQFGPGQSSQSGSAHSHGQSGHHGLQKHILKKLKFFVNL